MQKTPHTQMRGKHKVAQKMNIFRSRFYQSLQIWAGEQGIMTEVRTAYGPYLRRA